MDVEHVNWELFAALAMTTVVAMVIFLLPLWELAVTWLVLAGAYRILPLVVSGQAKRL